MLSSTLAMYIPYISRSIWFDYKSHKVFDGVVSWSFKYLLLSRLFVAVLALRKWLSSPNLTNSIATHLLHTTNTHTHTYIRLCLCRSVCDSTYSHYNEIIVIYDGNFQLNFQQDNELRCTQNVYGFSVFGVITIWKYIGIHIEYSSFELVILGWVANPYTTFDIKFGCSKWRKAIKIIASSCQFWNYWCILLAAVSQFHESWENYYY